MQALKTPKVRLAAENIIQAVSPEACEIELFDDGRLADLISFEWMRFHNALTGHLPERVAEDFFSYLFGMMGMAGIGRRPALWSELNCLWKVAFVHRYGRAPE